MTAVKAWVINCDTCGEVGEVGEKAHLARAFCRLEGWTHPRANPARNQMRIDLCPTCSQEAS